MPRPGPRPYECVRRAWHSERHQPMRGSLIQEIFRVVSEIHKPATKKNKEWQEKLPVVVLKVEEIMYSKANSEAEYMDIKTLWDRTNDAINTIIRCDESTETGEFLQPCIEAALNLGCTPQRTSRSQRNSNLRCYLSPCSQEHQSLSPGMVHTAVPANQATNSLCMPNYSYLVKSAAMNSHLFSDLPNLAYQSNRVSSNKFLLPSCDVLPSKKNQTLPLKMLQVPSFGSALPVHHGVCLDPLHSSRVYTSNNEHVKRGNMHDFFSCSNQAPEVVRGGTMDDHLDTDINCDLSLRLGSLSASSLSTKSRDPRLVEGEENCGDKGKLNERSHQISSKSKTSLSSTIDTHNSFDSYSTALSEHTNLDMKLKKRKAVFGHHEFVKDKPFFWQSKLPCNELTDRMKNSGS